MTNPTGSKGPTDVTTAVPTQRIVTAEVTGAHREPSLPRHGLVPPPRRWDDRVEATAELGAAADLPDLSAAMAAVPGGLGAEVVESFTYAGQHWTAADARFNGTPIGLQLAMEQRGLEVPGGELDLPLQRSGS